jgi:hypothetical protein
LKPLKWKKNLKIQNRYSKKFMTDDTLITLTLELTTLHLAARLPVVYFADYLLLVTNKLEHPNHPQLAVK